MNNTELASRLGMTRQNLSRLISQDKVRQDLMCSTLEKIARVLKVDISYFFDDDVKGGGASQVDIPVPRTKPNVVVSQRPEHITMQDLLEKKLLLLQQQVEVADKLFHELKQKVEDER